VVSAVFHGIYAGDVWQLSAKSLMPAQWNAEKEFGSVMLGIPKMRATISEDDFKLIRPLVLADQPSLGLRKKLREAGVITLRGGLGQLSERLESLLRMGGNVTFKLNTRVEVVKMQDDGDKIQVSLICLVLEGVHPEGNINTMYSSLPPLTHHHHPRHTIN
jgi:oxygen-dependent protoporphyrinogen oxidase